MKKYYPEIDGLRAIAVLAVLIFHLNPNGFLTGGYVGVDVFFVISGYLITGILYQNIANDNFNYFQFLNRRIARLYPALLFTVFMILILGFLIYSTEYYTEAANTITYTLFSISNFKFMMQKGYWDISSTENPLLHTWSLGVEQQFYLVFPLILFIAYKIFKSKKAIIYTIIFISIISFVTAQYLSTQNSSANFYFTASRLFELGIGGIFSVIGKNYKKISNPKKEILFSLGLILILACAIFYVSDIKYHPGITTLPVVVGSVLCILYGDAKYIGRIVRAKIVVYIGAISYSVYLIHWPLITFYKYLYTNNDLQPLEQIMLFIVTIVIAAIMYHFIENRYRRISISIFTKSGKVFLSLFILLFLINYIVIYFKGIPQRIISYSQDTVQLSTYAGFMPEYSDWNKSLQILGDKTKKPIAVFVGDSYLAQYIEQIDLFFKSKNEAVYFLGQHSCLFTDDIYNVYSAGDPACIKLTKEYYKILNSKLPTIRINDWRTATELTKKDNFYNEKSEKFELSFEQVFSEYNNQTKISKNKTLIILSQPMLMHTTENSSYTFFTKYIGKKSDYEKIEYKSDEARVKSNMNMIKLISNNDSFKYIEIYDLFCNQKICSNFNENIDNSFYYSYTGHLSRLGAKYVWENISDQIYQFILDNQKPID